MLTGDELDYRRETIAASADLQSLRARLLARARRTVQRNPAVPAEKGVLTADGGVCPEDGSALTFDPWSPSVHRCALCGRSFRGERHDRRWAWLGHLWLAERIAEAAMAGLLSDDAAVSRWAAVKVAEYGSRYLTYRNADNVLGPSHLFSSTYLESIWLTNYLAGAFTLREAGILDQVGFAAVSAVAEEAGNLIGEFDEGLSNRQTWHNAALAAAGVWFEDPDLVQRAVEGPRGLVGHLVDGFRADGMWYEGENYHLFALRGLLTGAGWARLAGVELFEEKVGRERLAAALRAPTLSALPDGAFPARKDSRYGVSLAQPMYLELWEHGVAGLVASDQAEEAADLAAWLRQLYALPAPPAEIFDSYLHEAGEDPPPRRGRTDLSWWMLATMAPDLPAADPWTPVSALLPEQGLAILRDGDRYASLECGEYGGGHGHPDRLHLALHARGVHWLADPGTGSYVSPDLFWYRSTLAHNAPRIDGVSQPVADARAEMFDVSGRWGWVRGKFRGLTRTIVAGPTTLVDVLEFAADEEHLVELPWHPDGEVEVLTPGRWEPAELEDAFAQEAERFVPLSAGQIVWRATTAPMGRILEGIFDEAGELLRARAPARPGRAGDHRFLIRRVRGRYVRLATVLAFDRPALTSVRFAPGEIIVEAGARVVHRLTNDGWEVEDGDARVQLRGLRRELQLGIELGGIGRELFKYTPPEVAVPHALQPPPLDGTLDGFEAGEVLHLDHEDQYRRTEEPYVGAEAFAAQARLVWDETALYVAVAVSKSDLVFRRVSGPALHLDNESDLIHSDGLQVYLQLEGRSPLGWLVVPDPASAALQVHAVAGTAALTTQVRGAWRKSEEGYVATIGISLPGWPPGPHDPPPRFDLVVNEMSPGRTRRLGQLVWTGGGGWSYLRGDRQDPARFGKLMLE